MELRETKVWVLNINPPTDLQIDKILKVIVEAEHVN